MEKKNAIRKGAAAAICLYYLIFFVLFMASAFLSDNPDKENDKVILGNGMFLMLFLINIISSLAALLAGHHFVRRYDRNSRWVITKALMVSLLIASAIFLIGSFQPAIYLFICVFACLPVLISHYITFVIRGIQIRKKRH